MSSSSKASSSTWNIHKHIEFYFCSYVMYQFKLTCNRFLQFCRSLIKSDISTIKVLLRRAIDSSSSSVVNNISHLWHRYKIGFHLNS